MLNMSANSRVLFVAYVWLLSELLKLGDTFERGTALDLEATVRERSADANSTAAGRLRESAPNPGPALNSEH
jgi:hypothetical protein